MRILPLNQFNLNAVSKLTETEAMLLFKRYRWENCDPLDLNDAVCPHCGKNHATFYEKDKRWKCRNPHCRKRFSLTSGTAFAYRKLSFKQILIFLVLLFSASNTLSSCEIARATGMTQKNAYLLKMRVTDVLLQTLNLAPMQDLIQIDGCYKTASQRFSSYLPKDRYQQAKQQKKSQTRCIVTICNTNTKDGTRRTLFAILHNEESKGILSLAQRLITPNSTIWTDRHLSYKVLAYQYKHASVNHSKEYKSKAGVHNNHCESIHSRFRAIQTIVHKIANHYLPYYMAETAYKSDKAKWSVGEKVTDVISRFFRLKPLRDWMNYHRSPRLQRELLGTTLIDHIALKQAQSLPISHCQ